LPEDGNQPEPWTSLEIPDTLMPHRSVGSSREMYLDAKLVSEISGIGRLHLDSNQITDLSPLADLKRLEILSITHTPSLVDVTPLAGLRSEDPECAVAYRGE
jgi:Leucine-rich repeat (LRR) protein